MWNDFLTHRYHLYLWADNGRKVTWSVENVYGIIILAAQGKIFWRRFVCGFDLETVGAKPRLGSAR
jgi:hypothetical protein